MASAIMGSVGATIGSTAAGTFGWTAATWSQIGWTAGVLAGSYLFAPDGPNIVQEGPRLDDLTVTTSTYGMDIPKVYGAYRIAGNIIWSLPLVETRHEEREEEGKGGGGSSSTTIWYTYKATFAVALCEGPISGIRKIWFGAKLVYDNGAYAEELTNSNTTMYNGTSDQAIDWKIQSDKPDTPAYRNIVYIVFSGVELEKLGNIIPNVTAEVSNIASFAIVFEKTIYPKDKNHDGNGSCILNVSEDDQYVYTIGADFIDVLSPSSFNYFKTSTSFSYSEPFGNIYDLELQRGMLGKGSYFNITILTDAVHLYVSSNGVMTQLVPDPIFVFNSSTRATSCFFENKDSIVFITHSITTEKTDLNKAIPGSSGYQSILLPTTTINYSLFVYNDIIYLSNFTTTTIDILEYTLEDLTYIKTTNILNIAPAPIANLTPDMVIDETGFHICAYNYYYQISFDYTIIRSMQVPLTMSYSMAWYYKNDRIYYLIQPVGETGHPEILIYNLNYMGDSSGQGIGYIVNNLALESGLLSTDVDVTEGIDIVTGYVISKNITARASMEPLLSAYDFFLVETDFKVVLRKKQQTPIYNIPEDSIGANTEEKLEYSIKQDLDLIKSLSIRYANSASDYQTSTQMVRRIDVNATNEMIVELPLALTDSQAKQIAEKELYKNWLNRQTFSFSLTIEYRFIIAGDVVTLNYDGYVKEVMITKVTITDTNIIQCQGIANNYGVFDSNSIGQDTGINDGGLLDPVGPSGIKVLNIPTIDNNLINSEGMYVAATGYSNSWRGCSIYTKSQTLDNFSQDISIISSTSLGNTESILEDGISYSLDIDSYVDVYTSNELFDITFEDLLSGKNYISIGNEILQYQNVQEIATSKYRLTKLLRGRRGTEWAISGHVNNEDFVFMGISGNGLGFIPKTIGNNDIYAYSTLGDSTIEEYGTKLYDGLNLKPFSPWYLKYQRVNNLEDINITWMRRSRYISGYLKALPIVDSPISYEVDVVLNSIVENTYTTSTESFSYTKTLADIDGVGTNEQFEINIYQISSLYGRGEVANLILYKTNTIGYSLYANSLNPKSYWKLGESSGSFVKDEIGYANGTYSNNPQLGQPSLISTEVDTSVRLVASLTHIIFVGTSTVHRYYSTSPFSVSIVIKTESGFYGNLIGRGGTTSNHWGLQMLSNNRVMITLDRDDGTILEYTSNTILIDGTVYHITFTYDGSQNSSGLKLYIDGSEDTIGVDSSTEPLSSGRLSADNVTTYIGSQHTANIFTGTIDDTLLFNREISANEISTLYSLR